MAKANPLFALLNKRRPIWKIISLLAIHKLCKEYVFRLLLCLLFPSFLTNFVLYCIFHPSRQFRHFFKLFWLLYVSISKQRADLPLNAKLIFTRHSHNHIGALKVESWFGIKKRSVCCSFGLITQPSRACLAIPQIRLRPVHRPNISPAYEYS